MRAKEFTKSILSKMKRDWFLPVTEHQVYSTEEQVIGVWTDGKPLYRKIWEISLSRTDQSNIKIISGYFSDKKPIHISGTIGGTDGHTLLPTNWFNVSPSERLTLLVYSGDVYLHATGLDNGGSLWSNQTIIVEAEYTKDSDTATASKVPFEPLREWSTEEKLVGYDEEGNAVYERTFVTEEFSFTANTNVQKTYSFTYKPIEIAGGFYMNKTGSGNNAFIPLGMDEANCLYDANTWAGQLFITFKRTDSGTAKARIVVKYIKS